MTSSTETINDGWGPALSDGERLCLRCVARAMIPASAVLGMPGADDPAIMADMASSAKRDRSALARLLRGIDEAAGGRLADLDAVAASALLDRLRAADPAGFAVAEAVIARAYYRDDRVLTAIGMEPRPPFPKGFRVDEGDWSLLDPVRDRGPIWRASE